MDLAEVWKWDKSLCAKENGKNVFLLFKKTVGFRHIYVECKTYNSLIEPMSRAGLYYFTTVE